MDFGFDDDQELLRSTTRRFLEERHPLDSMRPKLESDSIFDREVWREGAELGWASMLVPEAYGGGSITEQSVVDLLVIAEEMGRMLYPGPFLATNVVADCLGAFGTDLQCKETLEAIASGKRIASWCFTGDGSADLNAVEIEASPIDGGLRLEGVARYVHEADNADLLLVTCNSPSGPTLVLVPRDTKGIGVRVLGSIDLTRRFCEVTFESVEVPGDAVLGGIGQAAPAIERALRLATVLQSAEAVGAAEQIFETTVQYAKDRVQFGRAIGSFQAIKHRLADLLIELEGARAASWFAALAIADDREDRDEAVAVAGSTVREVASLIAGEALQIHGGVGFTWEYDVHLYLRRAKTDQFLYGDPAWHRERLCQIVETTARGED